MADSTEFDYSEEMNAMATDKENFAMFLKKMYEMYDNVWDKYLTIYKQHQNCKTVEQHSKYDNEQCNVSFTHKEQKEEEYAVSSDDAKKDVQNTFMTDVDIALKSLLSTPKKPPQEDDKNHLFVTSPIFSNKQSRCKRSLSSLKSNVSVGVPKKNTDVSLNNTNDMFRVAPKKSSKRPLRSIENQTTEFLVPKHSSDIKLGLDKSYGVDTTCLPNGKKLMQTRLMFKPVEKPVDVTLCTSSEDDESEIDETLVESCNPIESKKSQTNVYPYQNTNVSTKGLIKKPCDFEKLKILHDDIIESSPAQNCSHSKLKKHLQLKREQLTSHEDRTENLACLHSLSLSVDETEDEEVSDGSPILVDLDSQNSCEGNQVKMDSDNHKSDDESRSDTKENDETFFDFAKENIEKVKGLQSTGARRTDIGLEQKSCITPQAKKIRLSSHSPSPHGKEKKHIYPYKGKPVRNKAERAKLPGWDCWECKEYYENFDFTESQLQKRKNLCSRHRAKFKPKPDTPPGFWDHLFPDTQSSSCEFD